MKEFIIPFVLVFLLIISIRSVNKEIDKKKKEDEEIKRKIDRINRSKYRSDFL